MAALCLEKLQRSLASVTMSQLAQDPEPKAAKWNPAIIDFSVCAHAFSALTCLLQKRPVLSVKKPQR